MYVYELWRSYKHWESLVKNLNNSENKHEQAAVNLQQISVPFEISVPMSSFFDVVVYQTTD